MHIDIENDLNNNYAKRCAIHSACFIYFIYNITFARRSNISDIHLNTGCVIAWSAYILEQWEGLCKIAAAISLLILIVYFQIQQAFKYL